MSVADINCRRTSLLRHAFASCPGKPCRMVDKNNMNESVMIDRKAVPLYEQTSSAPIN